MNDLLTFRQCTTLDEEGLHLGLAPGLGVGGVELRPSFFHGFVTHPQVFARGLVALAEVTSTRYFNYTPESERDPVLSAHGDRLRAECFSACNGVYASLEVFDAGLDGGEIGRGTTNVDISAASRSILSGVSRGDLLHVDVGVDGLTASTLDASLVERPVVMPERWVRALGNVAAVHRGFREVFRVPQSGARAFIASLPPASSAPRSGWLRAQRGSLQCVARQVPGAVSISGLHRLSAAKRLLPHVQGVVVSAPDGSDPTAVGVMVSIELPAARLTFSLTDESWRGFSGEGSLLSDLARPQVREDADLISALLSFDPIIDVDWLALEGGLSTDRVQAALSVLATSGRVGWDVIEQSYFHRELPDRAGAIEKGNPRLVAARQLFDEGAVRRDLSARVGSDTDTGLSRWMVRSGKVDYTVTLQVPVGAEAITRAEAELPQGILMQGDLARDARCTCTWYLRHLGNRGPCKHILAASMAAAARA